MMLHQNKECQALAHVVIILRIYHLWHYSGFCSSYDVQCAVVFSLICQRPYWLISLINEFEKKISYQSVPLAMPFQKKVVERGMATLR
jgi:hypothetical protein